jgi:hypothetical protein
LKRQIDWQGKRGWLLTVHCAYGKARAALDSLHRSTHQAKYWHKHWASVHFAADAISRITHGQG